MTDTVHRKAKGVPLSDEELQQIKDGAVIGGEGVASFMRRAALKLARDVLEGRE